VKLPSFTCGELDDVRIADVRWELRLLWKGARKALQALLERQPDATLLDAYLFCKRVGPKSIAKLMAAKRAA
jgi:hypothetical protein